jgi:hypothetical protein
MPVGHSAVESASRRGGTAPAHARLALSSVVPRSAAMAMSSSIASSRRIWHPSHRRPGCSSRSAMISSTYYVVVWTSPGPASSLEITLARRLVNHAWLACSFSVVLPVLLRIFLASAVRSG